MCVPKRQPLGVPARIAPATERSFFSQMLGTIAAPLAAPPDPAHALVPAAPHGGNWRRRRAICLSQGTTGTHGFFDAVVQLQLPVVHYFTESQNGESSRMIRFRQIPSKWNFLVRDEDSAFPAHNAMLDLYTEAKMQAMGCALATSETYYPDWERNVPANETYVANLGSYCKAGILRKLDVNYQAISGGAGAACCPTVCGQCGGSKCEDRSGGAEWCCLYGLVAANVTCEDENSVACLARPGSRVPRQSSLAVEPACPAPGQWAAAVEQAVRDWAAAGFSAVDAPYASVPELLSTYLSEGGNFSTVFVRLKRDPEDWARRRISEHNTTVLCNHDLWPSLDEKGSSPLDLHSCAVACAAKGRRGRDCFGMAPRDFTLEQVVQAYVRSERQLNRLFPGAAEFDFFEQPELLVKPQNGGGRVRRWRKQRARLSNNMIAKLASQIKDALSLAFHALEAATGVAEQEARSQHQVRALEHVPHGL